VRQSQRAMTAGVLAGEYIKTINSPLLDLAIQVDTPDKLAGAPVDLAPNVRVHTPTGAFSGGSDSDPDSDSGGSETAVEMSATAWGSGASPYPGAEAPPRKEPKAGPNQMYDARNDTATHSTVMSTGVLTLEFAAEGGEEMEIAGLPEPFVVEMTIDPGSLACDYLSVQQHCQRNCTELNGTESNGTEPELCETVCTPRLPMFILCDGICVPRGSCNDRAFQFCSYYDLTTEEWVVDSNSPPGNVSEDGLTITCKFNHLTDMSSMMGAPPGAVMVSPQYIHTSSRLVVSRFVRAFTF
jgi:hypothetical protein